MKSAILIVATAALTFVSLVRPLYRRSQAAPVSAFAIPANSQAEWRSFLQIPGERISPFIPVPKKVAVVLIQAVDRRPNAFREGDVATTELNIGEQAFFIYSDGFIGLSCGADLQRGWHNADLDKALINSDPPWK